MSLRSLREEWEESFLSPQAVFSSKSRGRKIPEEPCTIRTEFQRDRDRIIHSKAFRRLMHKTQVFIAPEGDHFRTRLTHTLEVSQIARTIGRGLKLNEDLIEAISLGHDLGHTPFGHTGEDVLNSLLPEGFRHNEQSLRVVDKLERGSGLNLTWEVRDGILNHSGSGFPATLEGQIVRTADRIAYINHDIDDACRGGVLTEEDLPRECLQVLGSSHRERINTMVTDMIASSSSNDRIGMSPRVRAATDKLRAFLFENVYVGSKAKKEEVKARRLLRELYQYYLEFPEKIPGKASDDDNLERIVADYIAGMTDNFATARYVELFVPGNFRA